MPASEDFFRDDGSIFNSSVVAELKRQIESLNTEERKKLRDDNSARVARNISKPVLIAAGPGTGKSYLFLERIGTWLDKFPDSTVHVSSFVRKLVIDLENDIRRSGLSEEQKDRVKVSTLHSMARSIVEKSHGTKAQPMEGHIRMISQEWKEMVWDDLVGIQQPPEGAKREDFETQYQNEDFQNSDEWKKLREAYVRLCRFYNAIGFADSILLATDALTEDGSLHDKGLWIFDEFQDFNRAEEHLARTCIEKAGGILLAGDDDQAIYQKLKGSDPEIIRKYYRDKSIANAMLPFCGRSSYHICMGATAFLDKHQSERRIEKVYLPIDTADDSQRIQVVAASTKETSVKYVTDFIEQHRSEIVARRADIVSGSSKDPYLLILSLQREVKAFLRNSGYDLVTAVEEWRLEEVGPGEDYIRTRVYYRHHIAPLENFTLRKVFHMEGLDPDTAAELITLAMASRKSLAQVDHHAVANARRTCAGIAAVLEDEALDAETKAAAVAELIDVRDIVRLSVDLAQFPVAQGLSRPEEEEEIETVGLASTVELMTMMRAKGLSADHVILLGADSINLGSASPELFFVALTRARESLHLVIPLGGRGASDAHAFVLDLPEEHCDYLTFKATGTTLLAGRSGLVSYLARRKTARLRSAIPRSRGNSSRG